MIVSFLTILLCGASHVVEMQVGSSDGDAEQYNGTMYPAIDYQDVNWNAGVVWGMFRFRSWIPADAEIVNATLYLHCQTASYDDADFILYGEATANAAVAGATANNISSRTLTSASYTYTDNDLGLGWAEFCAVNCVQEIVEVSGYEPGNYINLITADNTQSGGTDRYRLDPWDEAPSRAARLRVEYIGAPPEQESPYTRVTLKISAGEDDAEQYGSTMYPTITYQDLNWYISQPWGMTRFSADIPANSTIAGATLCLYCYSYDDPQFYAFGEAAADAAAAGTSANNISSRTITSASYAHEAVNIGTGWEDFDVTDCVQEIVEVGGYGEGSHINIITQDMTNGSGTRFRIAPYEYGASYAPELIIEYAPPEAEASPTQRRIIIMVE